MSAFTSCGHSAHQANSREVPIGDIPPTHVDLSSGHCGTPASMMTVRNSSRPIARVFRATAAPGCQDELLQRFHSSSAAHGALAGLHRNKMRGFEAGTTKRLKPYALHIF